MRNIYFMVFAFFILSALVPITRISAESVTQSSLPGCNTLFMLDNQNTVSQLYATSPDAPDTVQLFKSKNLTTNPLEQRLIQFRSGQFGLIYLDRNGGHSTIRYTTFNPLDPISIVWEAPGDDSWRAHFPDVVELSNGDLIAVISYNRSTVEGRLLPPKSKCFDGYTDSKFFCTQDVRAKILKSIDKGLHWTQIADLDNDDIKVDRRGSFFHTSLAVGQGDQLYLLAVEQYYDPNHIANPINLRRDTETLWKSTNRGVNWTRISNVFTAPLYAYHSNEGDLVVEPSGRIVVVFSSNYHPGVVQGDQGDYLLITSSSDDGMTWTAPKTVGKFGPNKGAESMPSLQLINGNRYGIRFHGFSDPVTTYYSYVFSQVNSLSNWTSHRHIDTPDSGTPNINPVCLKNINNPALPADFNSDGHVNLLDYNLLLASYGTTYNLLHYNQLVAGFGQ